MEVAKILARKGHEVVTIEGDRTLAEAIRLLVEHDIGSIVVVSEARVEGILTERDILRQADRDPMVMALRRVDEVMTREVIVASPEDDVAHLMEVMTRNRVRHLPVIADGALRGLVSIGDVVNAVRRDAEAENRHLRDYVQGMVR
jgi:CBS domain-containing protein